MMTGIICSSRRMMYLPTPTPSRKGRKSLLMKHSVGPPKLLRRADTLSGISRACASLHLDRRGVEDTEGIDLHIGDPVRPGRSGQVGPQRSGREVRGQQCLGLLIQALASSKLGASAAWADSFVELRAVVQDPVGSWREGTLGVERRQVVLDRRVVRLPARRGRSPSPRLHRASCCRWRSRPWAPRCTQCPGCS